MRLRARVARAADRDVWVVSLWVRDHRGVAYLFGQRLFSDWASARAWALNRVGLRDC